jgi:hypothetical protein
VLFCEAYRSQRNLSILTNRTSEVNHYLRGGPELFVRTNLPTRHLSLPLSAFPDLLALRLWSSVGLARGNRPYVQTGVLLATCEDYSRSVEAVNPNPSPALGSLRRDRESPPHRRGRWGFKTETAPPAGPAAEGRVADSAGQRDACETGGRRCALTRTSVSGGSTKSNGSSGCHAIMCL